MTPQPDLNLELARQLMRKAAEDEALLDEVLSSPRVTDEVIGFHCQQAAEKLLKSVLAARGIVYRRTHDIAELLALMPQHHITVPPAICEVDSFTPFAVEYRYQEWPESDEPLDRESARKLVQALRTWVETQVQQEE